VQQRIRPILQAWCRPFGSRATGRLRTCLDRRLVASPPRLHGLDGHVLLGCFFVMLLATRPAMAQTQGNQANAPARSSLAPAAAVETQQSTVALATRGTVTFRETPLAEVILILSEQWNVNIIAGSDINGQVNGTFKNERLQSILDSILVSNGLQYRQIGNSIVVLSSSGGGESNRSSFRVEVLDVPARDAGEMEELITALRLQMSPEGQLVPITATGKLTLLDTPERIEAVKVLLAQIAPMAPGNPTFVSTNAAGASQQTLAGSLGLGAAPITTMELRPQFILASDMLKPLEMVLGGAGSVAAVEQENFLVVLGDATVHEKARLLLQQLDKPRPQVRITGYIYDVDLGELEKLGVDWGQKMMSSGIDANGVPNNMNYGGTGLLTPNAMTNSANTLSGVTAGTTGATGATGSTTGSAAAGAATAVAAAPGGQFLIRTLSSSFELQALVQALEQTKGSRLLADPHVTVVDRHMASLKVVTQVPVQQLTQTQQGGSIGSTAFKEAGIMLDVTPRIANDGTIEMEVAPTYSTVSGYSNGNPIIDTRTATSVVRVNHGQALGDRRTCAARRPWRPSRAFRA
jgi:general secretion pathway protein D